MGLGRRPGGVEGKETGNRIPGAPKVPPQHSVRLPLAAPSSLPSLAAVFRFNNWVNDRVAEWRGSGGGRPDDALSPRPAATEAVGIIEGRC